MIQIREVTKSYEAIKAVDSVSFSMEAGEAVALLGPNGAGKSTLIKCILGTLDFSGEITLNNLNIKNHEKEAKSLIGYVPQEPVFYDMTTLEVLSFFSAIRQVRDERIDEVLSIVGLKEHAFKTTTALSGGMKQRLSFAIALLSNSPILILDEPTSNLDAAGRSDFLKLIKNLKDEGKTLLFSSHRLDEVEFLADRVFVMKSGKIIFESTPNMLGEKLGFKMKLDIKLPRQSIEAAMEILAREGFSNVSLNGRSLTVEVSPKEGIVPLRKLLLAEIPVEDFNIQQTSMESIMEEVKSNGF